MYLTTPLKRKMLVLLNPFSGGGRSIRSWQTAQTMLTDAHIDITEQLTERPKHAFEIAQTVESGFDLIVVVSGDGLAHEVINGLMKRDDWETFKETITFSVIPGGTSNGLCTNVCKNNNERIGVLESTYRMFGGKRKNMDLIELAGEFDPKVFCFLMFSWGIVADIAQNSESMRCLGTGRYTVRGIYRILNIQQY